MTIDKKIILSIDSTNKNISVAISKGKKILSYVERLNSQDHSKFFVFIIEQALQRASLSYEDINYLIVTNGPGGFTSLRVSIAFAKSMTILNKKIVVGAVSNFEIYAFRAAEQVKKFHKNIVILEGFRNSFFIEIFDSKNKIYSNIIYENKLRTLITSLINENPEDVCIISGNAIKKSWDQLKDIRSLIFLPRFHFIRATYICKLAQHKILNLEKFQKLEPIYSKNPLD